MDTPKLRGYRDNCLGGKNGDNSWKLGGRKMRLSYFACPQRPLKINKVNILTQFNSTDNRRLVNCFLFGWVLLTTVRAKILVSLVT